MLDAWKPTTPVKREFSTVTTRAALEAVAAAARRARILAIDLELTRPEAMRASIVGVSLSTGAGNGAYVPLSHRYLGAPQQLSWDEVKQVLAPVLEEPAVQKVGHDLKHSEVVLARHGVTLAGLRFDTMLAAYLLDPEASTLLAKELAQRELGVPLVLFGDRGAAARSKAPAPLFDELDVEKATTFAAAKAETVASLAAHFAPRLESEGLARLFREVEMPLSCVLVDDGEGRGPRRRGGAVGHRQAGRRGDAGARGPAPRSWPGATSRSGRATSSRPSSSTSSTSRS